MDRIIQGCLIVGLILIITSFIKSRQNQNSVNYRKSNVNRWLDSLRNTNIISIFSSDTSKSNIKLLDKLKVITQCKRSEKLYKYVEGTKAYTQDIKQVEPIEALKTVNLIRIVVIICTLALCISVKIGFNNMIVKQSLNIDTIYKSVTYKIAKEDVADIATFIGDDYKTYLKNRNIVGLKEKIETYARDNRLGIDQAGIITMCKIYNQAYEEGKLNIKDYSVIAILAFLSNLLVILYINLLYRMYKVKLLKEFNEVELIAILHMNREGLNIFQILSEVNKYTVYLNPYIRRCLNKYNSDPSAALDKLIKEVDDENFTSFVSVLKSCLDKPKEINTEVLKLQRKLRFLSKKVDNEKDIEFKQLSLTVAQFPLISIFAFNLMLPFMTQLNSGSTMFM